MVALQSLDDLRYFTRRGISLLTRYGLRTRKGEQHLLTCMELLARHDASPTFFAPGRVVAKHSAFFREAQQSDVEFAIHGYDHVDFRHLSPEQATLQFTRSIDAFQQGGIQFEGFRCPYLSFTPDQRSTVPTGALQYSSNRTLWWDVAPDSPAANEAVFARLQGYYEPEPTTQVPAVPRMSDGLLELPASLPEDLQLFDGLGLDPTAVGQAWASVLARTHERGEHYVLVFHPELIARSATALEAVLLEAKRLTPAVWVAPLRAINRWWREKSSFAVQVADEPDSMTIHFDCSDRATVLVRNVETSEPLRPWDGDYQILTGRTLRIPPGQRPFIGLAPSAPAETATFLREQGYIVETGDEATRCTLYLEPETLARLTSEVGLIDHIESSPAPLVRFWRWPDGAKSALSITGDADALSLRDYLSRPIASRT